MAATTDLKPTVDDVALLLRTRTVGGPAQGGLGSDTGPYDLTTFDDTTRPNDEEVRRVIDTAYGAVLGMVGLPVDELPAEQVGAFTYAVSLQAAILIEVSFFRETANQELLNLWSGWQADSIQAIKEDVIGSPSHLTFGSLTISTVYPQIDPYQGADPMPGIDTPGTLSTPLADERPLYGNVPGMS